MDVGSINSKNTMNTMQSTQVKGSDDDFEKRLKAAAEKGDDSELKQVCKEFESIFISMMYKQMKATVPKSEYLQSDSASELFDSMLDDKLCEVVSQKGIGLGDMLYKQMSKQYGNNTVQADGAVGGVIDEKK